MRSRLVYALSAWLLSAVTLSVLALAGFSAWNLRHGFTAYLQARDLERFERFAALVEERFERSRGAGSGGPATIDMGDLLRELAMLEGEVRPMAPHRGERAPPPGARRAPHGPPPPRPPAPEGFGARVSVTHPDGRPWVKAPGGHAGPVVAERKVMVQGEVVAIARLRPISQASEGTERQFLTSQYVGIAGIAAGLLLLAGAGAVWLSRQWVRPLEAMQKTTARIAGGEFSARVPVDRGDEIGDLARNVNEMAAGLERIEGARRRWLADLSHEIRTPLTVLQAEIEALADGIRPFDAAAVASLRDDVRRMSVLVNDLHLLAMADLKALPCHWEDDDATQTIVRVLERTKRPAADLGLSLHWPQDRIGPIPVVWDATRIEQLLDNLLQNSMRYTDAPGTIAVDWSADGRRFRLAVEDSAPGVPADELPHLFEPLYRSEFARQRERGGSGLGLAICAAIVSAHGGRIEALPSRLGGVRVAVELPLAADEEAGA